MKTVRLGRPPKYDWNAWMDGDEWEVTHGVDFDCTAESFAILVRRTARTKGYDVVVSVSGDDVYFQFTERKTA